MGCQKRIVIKDFLVFYEENEKDLIYRRNKQLNISTEIYNEMKIADIEKQDQKAKKNGKILEDFNEADLNPNPEGGEEEEEEQQQGGRQEVRCAQQ